MWTKSRGVFIQLKLLFFSPFVSNGSVQLARDHNRSLCPMVIEYNDSFHSIDSFHVTEYEESLFLIEYNDSFHLISVKFDSFHFIGPGSFIFKIWASSNMAIAGCYCDVSIWNR